MAATTVIFEGSSPENISHAREFWKAFDANDLDVTSTLHVSGLSQRLPTAPASENSPNYFHQTITHHGDNPGFLKNLTEAQKRQKMEEDEYVNRVLSQKKEHQDILSKQRQERLKKEAIRGSVVNEMYTAFEDEQDVEDDDEDEATQAMNDIDEFDRMVKLAREQEKESTHFKS